MQHSNLHKWNVVGPKAYIICRDNKENDSRSNKRDSRLLHSYARSTVTTCLPMRAWLDHDQISQPFDYTIPTLLSITDVYKRQILRSEDLRPWLRHSPRRLSFLIKSNICLPPTFSLLMQLLISERYFTQRHKTKLFKNIKLKYVL